MSSYILWVGNVFKDEAVQRFRGLAASANYWRRGLLSGLLDVDVDFKVLGHRNEQAWPKGKLFPNEKHLMDERFDSTLVKWINLPGVRYHLLARSHISVCRRLIEESGVPSAVLTYNPTPWHLPLARYLQKRHQVPWVSVTLDYDHVEEGWDEYLNDAGHADGHVFLSYWAYEHCPCKVPKLHLDGGFEKWFGDELIDSNLSNPKVCLYSGKYTDYGGYDLLLGTVKKFKEKGVEFWFTGKIPDDKRNELEQVGSHVKVMGFVDDDKLHQLNLQADLFLNPRPSKFIVNKVAFPSKLVRYLAYGKPVVSTWTPGISPEYKNYLFVPTAENAAAFSEKIHELLALTSEQKLIIKEKIYKFLLEEKRWHIQAERLKAWLEGQILKSV